MRTLLKSTLRLIVALAITALFAAGVLWIYEYVEAGGPDASKTKQVR